MPSQKTQAKSQGKSTIKQKVKSPKLSRVDTLIITVGTRQIGWRCADGIVRCFGADGDKGAPPHIDELYKEQGIERRYHQDGDSTSRYGVRDLGERYFNYCQDSLRGDFSKVELLLDHKIIADSIPLGLKHIILWGTNQPESVSWNFRRSDTLWLAELMAQKIQAKWSNVKVDVLKPILHANNSEQIRLELEERILPGVLQPLSQQLAGNEFVLAIENTGCAPAIAQGLEICAAALVRQCQVLNLSPIEPTPLYQDSALGFRTAQTAQKFQFISVGDYFWPLERLRVISAWERGDFREAEIWLTSHQTRYEGLLYKLAGQLALSTNWEISKFLENKDKNGNEKGIGSWLQLDALEKWVKAPQLEIWKKQVQITLTCDFTQAWESSFLIYLQLHRENYTTAFMLFAQTLERLLYIYAKKDNWVKKGLVDFPVGYVGNRNEPSFFLLIQTWCQLKHLDSHNKWSQLLHRIREKRNEVVHNAKPITPGQVKALWSDNSLFNITITGNHTKDIMQLMTDVLKEVCHPTWDIPKQPLLRSLYEWGLNLLRR